MADEIKLSVDTNDRFGMFKVGSQDHLVTALESALPDDRPRRATILSG